MVSHVICDSTEDDDDFSEAAEAKELFDLPVVNVSQSYIEDFYPQCEPNSSHFSCSSDLWKCKQIPVKSQQ